MLKVLVKKAEYNSNWVAFKTLLLVGTRLSFLTWIMVEKKWDFKYFLIKQWELVLLKTVEAVKAK